VRIVLVNVNTSESVTESLRRHAARFAASGTEIHAITPFFGPAAVEGYFDGQISAAAVMDRVAALTEPYDAIIEGGFGEGGQPGLQEMVAVPVISITDAAAFAACLLGRRFSVMTTVPQAARQVADRLLLGGLRDRCASIRPTGLQIPDLERDPGSAVDLIVKTAALAVAEDGADVICLGCAAMADLQDQIAEAVAVPVVEGVSAAVKLAEALHVLGLRPGLKAGSEPRSQVPGWPLHRYLPRP
jgi:allantoin racemase